eukprot:g20403.t1
MDGSSEAYGYAASRLIDRLVSQVNELSCSESGIIMSLARRRITSVCHSIFATHGGAAVVSPFKVTILIILEVTNHCTKVNIKLTPEVTTEIYSDLMSTTASASEHDDHSFKGFKSRPEPLLTAKNTSAAGLKHGYEVGKLMDCYVPKKFPHTTGQA